MKKGDGIGKEIIREAIKIIRKYGGVEYAKEYARKIVREAWEEVNPLLPNNRYKELLHQLATFLVEREM